MIELVVMNWFVSPKSKLLCGDVPTFGDTVRMYVYKYDIRIKKTSKKGKVWKAIGRIQDEEVTYIFDPANMDSYFATKHPDIPKTFFSKF